MRPPPKLPWKWSSGTASRSLEKENNNLKIQSELAGQLMKKKNALMQSIAGITILLAALLILGVYFLRRMRLSSLKLEEKNLVITRQNLELDNMNRTKDRMMSIIAHDLRGTMGNQITAIDVLTPGGRFRTKGFRS